MKNEKQNRTKRTNKYREERKTEWQVIELTKFHDISPWCVLMPANDRIFVCLLNGSLVTLNLGNI